MAVESAQWISELDPNSPLGSDFINEGDNHVRLTKSVLQRVFPNAGKAFRFPASGGLLATDTALATTDQNKIFAVNAGAGNRIITLPTTSADLDGFEVSVVKWDGTVNTVTVKANGATLISGQASLVLSLTGDIVRLIYSHTLSQWVAIRSAIAAASAFNGGTISALLVCAADVTATTIANKVVGTESLQVFNAGNPSAGAAAILFSRGAGMRYFLGLDTDGTLRIGGGTLGANSYKVFSQAIYPEIGEVNGLSTALGGKAASAHTHAQSDISGLAAALAAKAPVTSQTSGSETVYDIGTLLLATSAGVTVTANATIAVYRGNPGFFNINLDGAGTQLTGTWKARSSGDTQTMALVQRVA